MVNRLAYLGPSGTFCEEAANRYIGDRAWTMVSYPSIEAVFAAVQHGEAETGIVPIENSCEGAVNLTLDLLAYEYDLKITGELILPVRQNLMVRTGVKLEDITCVLSHPQALAQCRQYLSGVLTGRELAAVDSTAEAARRVGHSDEPWAAVGTAGAARAYGLEILCPDIQDRVGNETRFITLSRTSGQASGDSCLLAKTSLVLYLLDKPGALFSALEQFYLQDINLTRIESRPARTRIGDYLFFIDIEGNCSELRVIKALEGLKEISREIKILGSY